MRAEKRAKSERGAREKKKRKEAQEQKRRKEEWSAHAESAPLCGVTAIGFSCCCGSADMVLAVVSASELFPPITCSEG